MKRKPHRAKSKPTSKWYLMDGFNLFISATHHLQILLRQANLV